MRAAERSGAGDGRLDGDHGAGGPGGAPGKRAPTDRLPGLAGARLEGGPAHTPIEALDAGARLHHGPASAEAAAGLGVPAFAFGTDVFLGAGAPALDTPDGAALLAHEVTHVRQSRAGAPHVPRGYGESGGDAHEGEAQRAGAQARLDAMLADRLRAFAGYLGQVSPSELIRHAERVQHGYFERAELPRTQAAAAQELLRTYHLLEAQAASARRDGDGALLEHQLIGDQWSPWTTARPHALGEVPLFDPAHVLAWTLAAARAPARAAAGGSGAAHHGAAHHGAARGGAAPRHAAGPGAQAQAAVAAAPAPVRARLAELVAGAQAGPAAPAFQAEVGTDADRQAQSPDERAGRASGDGIQTGFGALRSAHVGPVVEAVRAFFGRAVAREQGQAVAADLGRRGDLSVLEASSRVWYVTRRHVHALDRSGHVAGGEATRDLQGHTMAPRTYFYGRFDVGIAGGRERPHPQPVLVRVDGAPRVVDTTAHNLIGASVLGDQLALQSEASAAFGVHGGVAVIVGHEGPEAIYERDADVHARLRKVGLAVRGAIPFAPWAARAFATRVWEQPGTELVTQVTGVAQGLLVSLIPHGGQMMAFLQVADFLTRAAAIAGEAMNDDEIAIASQSIARFAVEMAIGALLQHGVQAGARRASGNGAAGPSEGGPPAEGQPPAEPAAPAAASGAHAEPTAPAAASGAHAEPTAPAAASGAHAEPAAPATASGAHAEPAAPAPAPSSSVPPAPPPAARSGSGTTLGVPPPLPAGPPRAASGTALAPALAQSGPQSASGTTLGVPPPLTPAGARTTGGAAHASASAPEAVPAAEHPLPPRPQVPPARDGRHLENPGDLVEVDPAHRPPAAPVVAGPAVEATVIRPESFTVTGRPGEGGAADNAAFFFRAEADVRDAHGNLILRRGQEYLFKLPETRHAEIPGAAEAGLTNDGSAPRRATAAAQIAERMGIDTPEVHPVTIDGRVGTVQPRIQPLDRQPQRGRAPGTQTRPGIGGPGHEPAPGNRLRSLAELMEDDPSRAREIMASEAFRRAADTIRTLDYVLNNIDRGQNWGNYIIETTAAGELVRLIPIDHDLTLGAAQARTRVARPIHPGVPLAQESRTSGVPGRYPRDVLARLRQMIAAHAQVRRDLRAFLADAEIDGVFHRIQEILADADAPDAELFDRPAPTAGGAYGSPPVSGGGR